MGGSKHTIASRWEADGARRYDVKLSSEATTDTVQNGFEVGRENEKIIRSGFLICNIASLLMGDPKFPTFPLFYF